MTTIDVGNPYHPDPVRTGSALADDTPCSLCGRRDTPKYEGEASFRNGKDVDEEKICTACINDGTAHERLGSIFTRHLAAEDGWADDVSPSVVAAIRERTPAVFTWQAPRWLACCGDACVYLGVVDEATAGLAAAEGEVLEASIGPAGNSAPSWYLFRCMSCARYRTFDDAP